MNKLISLYTYIDATIEGQEEEEESKTQKTHWQTACQTDDACI